MVSAYARLDRPERGTYLKHDGNYVVDYVTYGWWSQTQLDGIYLDLKVLYSTPLLRDTFFLMMKLALPQLADPLLLR